MAAVKHIFILVLVLVIRWAEGQPQIYNVRDFHAFGDGETDDAEVTTQPFEYLQILCVFSYIAILLICFYHVCRQSFFTTWQAACNDSHQPTMVVPGGRTFLLSHIRFEGPCKSPITVQVSNIDSFAILNNPLVMATRLNW